MDVMRTENRSASSVAIIAAAMPHPSPELTEEQLRAVSTTGRSVIVSAAAGSGKTTVLAERCAYLVCDAPADQRCDIDSLLVLTFTDAAAAEMRSRIIEAIRRRAEERPNDKRLRDQLALADAAQISTIHSFCLWMVRRWFSHLEIDPTAAVLDADEASILKKETLDRLFNELYGGAPRDGHILGADTLDESGSDAGQMGVTTRIPNDDLPRAFARLVEVYGLGEERDVAAFVLRLHEFTTSLPDPGGWLADAITVLTEVPNRLIEAMADELGVELRLQYEHCNSLAGALEAGEPAGHYHAGRIREYAQLLSEWLSELEEHSQERLAGLDRIFRLIGEFRFPNQRAPRLPREAPEAARTAREAASKLYSKEVKEKLFRDRLKNRFGLFSKDEWTDGLARIAPFVATLVDLVHAFRDAYNARKRKMNVLDFSDLERFAFRLLSDGIERDQPSDTARLLQDRFAHVLVDEYQDINPLQQAILRLVSREADSKRTGNLFVVGDVKQSIYRFRLAEPNLFLDRLSRFAVDDGNEFHPTGEAIFLQRNFRSRPEIVNAVNLVFRKLMPVDGSGMSYDERAELHAGRTLDTGVPHVPVEVHLLERQAEGTAGDSIIADADADDAGDGINDDEGDETPITQEQDWFDRGVADPCDSARWTPIEREAFLIGNRIRELVSERAATTDSPLVRYRDIAILLRATKVNADRMAGILSAQGIPTHAQASGSLLAALESRDVLAVLQVLDNPQQDIPLAAVLRSGIVGEQFSEDELVRIRLIDREMPFHAAVREYARRGEDAELCARLSELLERIDRYRNEVRHRPLADMIWNLYQRRGYLAYAAGLPNGMQRRANLLKLHNLSRKFGSFRRQGLHRFLRFIESMDEDERGIGVAPAIGEADDVVRIMSIHQAKGLEFPVVFVAGLGTKFHLGDRSGRMIFERRARISLRVVDTDSMIEYLSATHQLAASEIERSTRDEEMRILYVAMTRARDRLILVGSMYQADEVGSARKLAGAADCPLTRMSVATARTPLDWLIPALDNAPPGSVAGLADKAEVLPSIRVFTHGADAMRNWRLEEATDPGGAAARGCVAGLGPLPDAEPRTTGDAEVERVLSQMKNLYPWLSASSVRATVAASEFKGAFDYRREFDTQLEQDRPEHAEAGDFMGGEIGGREQAAKRGIQTHRILQHLNFEIATDADGLASELQRMVDGRTLNSAERNSQMEDAIGWFVTTPLAAAIRSAGSEYRRELRFITTEPLTFFDPTVTVPQEDRVLVRGIVDGILPIGDGVEIVDFKTDAVSAGELPSRCELYRPQMALYSRAVERLWHRPVRRCWLVFLTPRVIEAMNNTDGTQP